LNFIIIIYLLKTIEVDNGYLNEQNRKAHCALTSAHNFIIIIIIIIVQKNDQ